MDIKQVAKETSKVLASYLTYQAVRIITDQLWETNPGQAIWLSEFSSTGKIQRRSLSTGNAPRKSGDGVSDDDGTGTSRAGSSRLFTGNGS